jgi:putative hydrolase of HD superfamily
VSSLQQLIDFIAFTHEIRNVKRAMLLETVTRHENDAEHCYQLALAGWFLIDCDILPFDRYRVIGMAMVHDVAEAYAGDLTAFASKKERDQQTKREEEAIERLKKEWPAFISLHELIQEYEERKTTEAKFVYSLDKLLPMINNYLYEGKAWKQQELTLEDVKRIKKGKVDLSPNIEEYYHSMINLLEKNELKLFGVAQK